MPSNVYLVGPQSHVSTYAAMLECDSVIIFGTKTGVELTSWGSPSSSPARPGSAGRDSPENLVTRGLPRGTRLSAAGPSPGRRDHPARQTVRLPLLLPAHDPAGVHEVLRDQRPRLSGGGQLVGAVDARHLSRTGRRLRRHRAWHPLRLRCASRSRVWSRVTVGAAAIPVRCSISELEENHRLGAIRPRDRRAVGTYRP